MELTNSLTDAFKGIFEIVQEHAHKTACKSGWWDKPATHGESIALIHSEVSEMLEALRGGNPESKKIPEFDELELEAADVVIRLMDYCQYHKIDLADAIIAKMRYNETRPYKHGKEF